MPAAATDETPPGVLTDDTDRLSEVETGVAGVLPVLPVVCRQLAEAAGQVEQAVVGVCGDFQAISDVSRESVDRAARCLEQSGAGGRGVQQLTEVAGATIARLLERTEEAQARLIETAGRVGAVEEGVRAIEQIARKVDRVSGSIKVLSLNARIEASRAGAAGRAFAVVARETGKVASEAAEMNQAIQDVTRRLSGEVRAIAAEIRDRVAAGRAQVESARAEVGLTLGELAEASRDLRQAVEAAARDAEEVTRAIGRAVIALQFQDANTQRVTHAVETLGDVGAELAGCLPPPDRDPQLGPEWEARMARRYTMPAEHAALRGDAGPAGDSVELF